MIKMKSILKEGKGFYHGIWETMMRETAPYMKPTNQMVSVGGAGGTDRKSGKLTWGKPGSSVWFAELVPTHVQKDGTAMHALLTVECKESIANQLWEKLSSKFLGNMKPGDPTPGYSARTWVINIDSDMRAAGMINWLATNVKGGVNESYAWERKEGEPLPTLKSVAERYQKNLKEQGSETTDLVLGNPGKQVNVDPVQPEVYDINGELLPEVPADLNKGLRTQNYREVTVSPKYYFQTKNMGETSYVRYDVKTGQLIDNKTGEELVKLNPGLPARQVYLWLRRNHMGKRDDRFQRENVNEAYDSHNMSALIELYHQYKDGGMSKEVFYQLLKILTHDEREELMGYIKTRRDDEKYNLPDESPMDYSEDFMEEAYDAKGVEEAKDKKPAKKSDKASKGKRWQDNDGDGKWYEKGDDVSEGDESALNMGSLEESKFWGRVKGNLHGHEYILRETFKK